MKIDCFSATFLCIYVMVEVVKIPKDIKDVIRNCKTMDSPLQYQYQLGNDHLTWKGGGLWFFSKKNILIPNVAEKNILLLVEEKKNNLIQSFCHIT